MVLRRQPQQRGRAASGPGARSKGARASSVGEPAASASRARPGRPAGPPPAGAPARRGGSPARAGRRCAGNVVRSASWRRTSSARLRARARRRRAAREPQRDGHVVERAARARAGRGTTAAAGRRRAAAGPLAWHRHQMAAASHGPRPGAPALELAPRGPPRWAPRRGRAGAARRRRRRAPARPPGWPAASGRPGRRSRRATPDPLQRRAPRPRARPAPPPRACAAPRTRRRSGPRPSGRRQRPPVHLAVGRQRQRVQDHEGRRHHVAPAGLLQVPRSCGDQCVRRNVRRRGSLACSLQDRGSRSSARGARGRPGASSCRSGGTATSKRPSMPAAQPS